MGMDDESSHPALCSEVAGGVTQTIVYLFREPNAGNLPVRFNEREQETEPYQTGLRRRRESFVSSHRETKATAPCSRLYSPHQSTAWNKNRVGARTKNQVCWLERHNRSGNRHPVPDVRA